MKTKYQIKTTCPACKKETRLIIYSDLQKQTFERWCCANWTIKVAPIQRNDDMQIDKVVWSIEDYDEILTDCVGARPVALKRREVGDRD